MGESQSKSADMEDEFTCPICLDIASNAVETSCCHHLFCEDCLTDVHQSCCPNCRSCFTTSPSHIARRIIGNMRVECEFACGASLARSDLKCHLKICEKRPYNCPAPGCSFQGEKELYCSHLMLHHKDSIVQNAERCFDMDPQSTEVDGQQDRIKTTKNRRGKIARLGSTGKFYCGESLHPYCSCCNGRCGPTNGCNCEDCMLLDVQKQMLPRKWFVNREGRAVRLSGERYYCGCRVLEGVQGTIGYCGPTDGPNCKSCEILQSQVHSRYASIW